jgi:hypothetical protein
MSITQSSSIVTKPTTNTTDRWESSLAGGASRKTVNFCKFLTTCYHFSPYLWFYPEQYNSSSQKLPFSQGKNPKWARKISTKASFWREVRFKQWIAKWFIISKTPHQQMSSSTDIFLIYGRIAKLYPRFSHRVACQSHPLRRTCSCLWERCHRHWNWIALQRSSPQKTAFSRSCNI